MPSATIGSQLRQSLPLACWMHSVPSITPIRPDSKDHLLVSSSDVLESGPHLHRRYGDTSCTLCRHSFDMDVLVRSAEHMSIYVRIRQKRTITCSHGSGCDSCGGRLAPVGHVGGLQMRESAGPKVRVRRAKALIEVKIRFARRASADDVQRVLHRCLGKDTWTRAR